VLWACNFLQWGTTARVAFLTGREDRQGAAASAAQALWLGVGLGAVLAVVVGALAALVLATSVAARVGPTTLGGHQIAYQTLIFLAFVMDALALSVQAIVGTQLGAGDVDGARTTSTHALRLGYMAGAALCIVVMATSPVLPRVFTSDPHVVYKAMVALLFVGAMQLASAPTFVLDGVLMGGADFAYVKWVTVASFIVFIPFAAAVLASHRLGITVIWAGLLVWITARAALNWLRFRGPRWTVISDTDLGDRQPGAAHNA